MNRLKKYICYIAAFVLVAACDDNKDMTTAPDGAMTVNFAATRLAGDSNGQPDATINTVNGYRFDNGVLKEVFAGIKTDASGNGLIKPAERKGVVYFVANDNSATGWESEVTRLDEFMETVTEESTWRTDNLPMTGMMELDGTGYEASVNMKRAVARLDVDAQTYGVEVYDVTVTDVADRGFLWEQSEMKTPASAVKNDWSTTFETPLKNVRQTLMYMAEQKNSGLMVEVNVAFGGGMHLLTASLPAQIKRNTVYTLKVNGTGGKVTLSVTEDSWDEGVQSDAVQNMKGLVDVDASVFSDGVSVNNRRDTVFVSYRENVFKLALLAEQGAEVQVEGMPEGVDISVENITTRALQKVANVNISSEFKTPGRLAGREYAMLKVYKNGVLKGNVVVAFDPNPLKLEGRIRLDNAGICDFGTYVEGEIGRITVPQGKKIELAFDEGEDLWATTVLAGDSGNEYRVLAGWRPNDPKADGRTQQVYLVVENNDGTDVEKYTIKRKNFGLPVVNVNGTWWCKYNLRGNVKNFEDQISISEDRDVIGGDVRSYMETCTNDEFRKLLGDQYQGGNVNALKLAVENGAFYYEGFSTSASDFSDLAVDAMTPEGYRLPTYNDMRFFTWGNNSNMGYGTDAFNNGLGQRLGVYTQERIMTLGEEEYGPVMFYEFTYEDARIVFCGLGHQWNAEVGNISKQMVMLATYGSRGSSWYIEGYPQDSGKGNWFKFGAQNSTKTRTIRCVKADVEYTY